MEVESVFVGIKEFTSEKTDISSCTVVEVLDVDEKLCYLKASKEVACFWVTLGIFVVQSMCSSWRNIP